jgi:hypothetical protein
MGTGTDNQTNVYDDLQAGKPNMMGSYKKVVDTGSINMSYSSEKDVDIMVGAVLKDSGGTYPKTINIT